MERTATMQTRLTELLGIEHPVMLAGMGGVSYHRLAAAVSEAGGIGTLGAATMDPQTMDDEMAAMNAATDRPWGVDLLTAMPGDMAAQVQRIIDAGARIFVGALGVPREVITLCHDADVLVVNMCGRVHHAVLAVEAGCDLVVAQGTEAGGHTGKVATMPLVPQMVDAGSPRRWPSVPTGCGWAPDSSPPLRPGYRSGTTTPCWHQTRARPRSAAPTAASRCG
jgi:enoyl-[acyl-carrier protein] reductase II